MNNSNITFSERLKYAMDIRNVKQVELSNAIGVSKTNMSYYLSGKNKPREDKINLIAKELNVNPIWLLGYNVPMEQEQTVNVLVTANRIKDLRIYNNWTKKDLANRLGLSEKELEGYEIGYNTPNDYIKYNMCKVFNCTMDYLMGLTSTNLKLQLKKFEEQKKYKRYYICKEDFDYLNEIHFFKFTIKQKQELKKFAQYLYWQDNNNIK